MGRIFPKLQSPIGLPDSVALVKSLKKSSVYWLEIIAQMHLKLTLLYTIQLLNDFDQLFLIKFAKDNLILFILYCVRLRFSG